MTNEIFSNQFNLLIAGIITSAIMLIPMTNLYFVPKEQKTIFGIPITVIGIMGYFTMSMMLTLKWIPYWTYGIAVIVTIAFTIFLIAKKMKHKISCPPCILIWGINLLLLILYIRGWIELNPPQ